MKIVHIYGHSYGGNFVITQLKELQKQGHDLLVICPSAGPFSENLDKLNIPVEFINFQGAKISDIPRVMRSIFTIRKTIKTFGADIVHYHLIKAIIVGRLASIGLKAKRFAELGGPLTLEMRFFRWLDISTAWIDDTIICSSYAIRDIYSRYAITKNKCQVLHYAFPVSPFLSVDKEQARERVRKTYNIDDKQKVVGMVSYLYESNFRQFKDVGLKGHETLVEAAKTIIQQEKNVHFLIVGQDIDGGDKYLKRLQQHVASLELTPYFTFTGFQKNVPEMLAAMDIAAVPSLSENCGGAVEPLLMNIPVVASNVGGLTDIVIENETGWLAEPANSESLANAITQALATPAETRDVMGNKGRELVYSLFEPEANGKRLVDIYQSSNAPAA